MIDPAAIFAHDFGAPVQTYDQRDAILYALGLGMGGNPLDPAELGFLDERALRVLPTFAVTLCTPGMWIRDPGLGVDFNKLVHSAQWAEFPHPLPPSASVRGTARVVSLTDRGAGRGAVLELERSIADAKDGRLYCRLRQTLLLRGDGGFGGDPAPREERFQPSGPADAAATVKISPRAALIYRLSGDWNPLHLDPALAQAAGFSRPILQGLASYGMAAIAASRALGRDPGQVGSLACRFTGAVLPGDELEVKVWSQSPDAACFEAFVADRKVLDNGTLSWRSL